MGCITVIFSTIQISKKSTYKLTLIHRPVLTQKKDKLKKDRLTCLEFVTL